MIKKKDQIAAFIKFGEEAPEYGKQYGDENLNDFYPEHKFRLKIFLDLLHLIKPNKILDVGCGSGQPLLSILKNGFNANGFDFSPEMVEQSQKLLTENGFDPNKVSKNNMEDIQGIENASFDCIVGLGSLYYSRNFNKTMKDVANILPYGGNLIFSLRNDLFSFFSQNKYSLSFLLEKMIPFQNFTPKLKNEIENFYSIRYPDQSFEKKFNTVDDKKIYSLSHNPLTVENEVLKPVGLKLENIYYYHFHSLPPVFEHTNTLEFRQQSVLLENPTDWRGAFMSSSFVVHATKC